MLQILQNLKNGEIDIAEIPVPEVKANHVLIKTTKTLISIGTEKMLLDFGKSNILQKAKKQPEKVQQVLNKMKTDGIKPTLDTVFNKLDTPLPLGYCNVGIVEAVGEGITEFKIGDRVVSNGHHAEYVCVSKNLCAKIPDSVSDNVAIFTVPSSIALQGIRLAQPQIGETVVVIGLGLLGLLTVQILKANGCQVLGVDLDPKKRDIAEKMGIKTAPSSFDRIQPLINSIGADIIIITASTTSNDPLHLAAQLSRKRGKIILIGVIGREWNRSDFYEKELQFQVSCSYGPGRYDSNYEDKGIDYPVGYVRWTEQRNFQAILDLMNQQHIHTEMLINKEVKQDQAKDIYNELLTNPNLIGVAINYHPKEEKQTTIQISTPSYKKEPVNIGFIGAGNFTKQVMLPAINTLKLPIYLNSISSQSGLSSTHLAKKFKIENSTTDNQQIFNNPDINSLMITTQSSSHGDLIIKGLKAKKHIFVEKPLCLSKDELATIIKTSEQHPNQKIAIGFNRRYSSHIQKAKELLSNTGPKSISMMINSGFIPHDNWNHDGGGRIIQEAIHFIDLAAYLIQSPIESIYTTGTKHNPKNDIVTIQLTFQDGSTSTINYFSNGHKSYPKETITVFYDGKILNINNFLTTTGYGISNFKKHKTMKQDKGFAQLYESFFNSIITGTEFNISKEDIFNHTKASFLAFDSLISNEIKYL